MKVVPLRATDLTPKLVLHGALEYAPFMENAIVIMTNDKGERLIYATTMTVPTWAHLSKILDHYVEKIFRGEVEAVDEEGEQF